eukprot:201719-Rhodomonas_salina.3
MVLRKRDAKPGTKAGCARQLVRRCAQPVQCVVLKSGVLVLGGEQYSRSTTAHPVASKAFVRVAICLRARCATFGTDLAYAASRACYAMSSTGLAGLQTA